MWKTRIVRFDPRFASTLACCTLFPRALATRIARLLLLCCLLVCSALLYQLAQIDTRPLLIPRVIAQSVSRAAFRSQASGPGTPHARHFDISVKPLLCSGKSAT